MLKEPTSTTRKIVTGIAAGLAAGIAAGLAGRLLDRWASPEPKPTPWQTREKPEEDTAGPAVVPEVLGQDLAPDKDRRTRSAFGLIHAVLGGVLYAGLRERYSVVPRSLGLPFALAAFLGREGGLEPLLRGSPGLHLLPWGDGARKLAKQVVWAVSAEAVHRMAARIPSGRLDEILSNYPYTLGEAAGRKHGAELPRQ